jgi:hypothetical protein
MAFKLTYTDGQADDYDDDTKWEVEGGVLKLGKESGNWTVFVSPGHWATIELVQRQDKNEKKDNEKKDEDKRDKDRAKEEDQAKDQDADEAEDEKSADEEKDRAEAS